jgi:hypothetical protein
MENKQSLEHFPLIERLHTDVLEDKYGPITAKVIRHDNEIREVHLIDEGGVSRTYALTFFTHDNQSIEEITQINEQIKSGSAIGKAFKEHGYSIRKNVIDVYTIHLSKELKSEFQHDSDFAKARLSEFYAKKENGEPIIYGTVVEIYSPDFRGPVINPTDISQINPSTAAFEQAGINKEQVWDHLGQSNTWDDMTQEYEQAKEKSLPLVKRFKHKIEQYIEK